MTSPRRSILENVFSLSSLQIANYIAPLVVLPYLARVLGPANYGEVLFSQSFIQFIIVFVDYGFMHNGSREVAVCRDDPVALRRYFTESLIVRSILLFFSAAVLLVLCAAVEPFSVHPLLHIFTFGMVISDVLTMPFFFLGLERMRFIAIAGIGSRALTIAGILLFITEPDDFLYATLVYSVCYLGSGAVSFLYAFRIAGWKFAPVTAHSIALRFRENVRVFVTSASITAASAGNMLILRIFAPPEAVGIYGVVDKVIMAAVSLANPVFHSVLPYIARLAKESSEAALRRVRQTAWIAAAGGTAFLAVVYFGSGFIVHLVFGGKYAASEGILQLLAALPAGMWVTMVLGNLYFIAFGKYRVWSRFFTLLSISGIALALFFTGVLHWEGAGIAAALLIRVYGGLLLLLFLFYRGQFTKSSILASEKEQEFLEV